MSGEEDQRSRRPDEGIVIRGDAACLDLWYPRISKVKFVRLDLMDVRAADGIRISYDFERDGWKIEQASRFWWSISDTICDPDWQEVAFIEAWSRAETEEQENARITGANA